MFFKKLVNFKKIYQDRSNVLVSSDVFSGKEFYETVK